MMLLNANKLLTVLTVSIRLASLLLLTPITPIRQLPITVRVSFILLLSAIIVTGLGLTMHFDSEVSLIVAGSVEVINGLILSLTVFALFGIYQIAGLLIDSQMGLNATTILNPQANSHEPIMANFLTMLAVLLFFTSGGHRYFFQAIAYSFVQLPPGTLLLTAGLKPALTQFSQLFSMGLMIAAPIVFSLLLLDITAGLITRNMPQVSVYFVTLPIKILLGFVLVYLSLTYYQPVMSRAYQPLLSHWQGVLS